MPTHKPAIDRNGNVSPIPSKTSQGCALKQRPKGNSLRAPNADASSCQKSSLGGPPKKKTSKEEKRSLPSGVRSNQPKRKKSVVYLEKETHTHRHTHTHTHTHGPKTPSRLEVCLEVPGVHVGDAHEPSGAREGQQAHPPLRPRQPDLLLSKKKKTKRRA